MKMKQYFKRILVCTTLFACCAAATTSAQSNIVSSSNDLGGGITGYATLTYTGTHVVATSSSKFNPQDSACEIWYTYTVDGKTYNEYSYVCRENAPTSTVVYPLRTDVTIVSIRSHHRVKGNDNIWETDLEIK